MKMNIKKKEQAEGCDGTRLDSTQFKTLIARITLFNRTSRCSTIITYSTSSSYIIVRNFIACLPASSAYHTQQSILSFHFCIATATAAFFSTGIE
jgi:malate/lactate dehydrogenase